LKKPSGQVLQVPVFTKSLSLLQLVQVSAVPLHLKQIAEQAVHEIEV
jgi:hypothetical protein